MLPYLFIALSTFASEDLTCIAAGLLVAQRELNFAAGSAACAAGIFAGDLLLVLAGRSARFERLRARAGFLRGNVSWKLAVTRFTPGLRLPIYVAAGLARIPLRRVIPPLLLGAAIWTPLLVGAAEWLGGAVVTKGLKAIEVVVFAVLGAKLAIRYRVFSYDKRRLALARLHRLLRWEFWPSWAAYLPLSPHLLWLAIRHRSLTLFTAANPGIATGGLVGESKASILRHLCSSLEHVARWRLLPAAVDARSRLDLLHDFMRCEALTFPVVLKPDVGERGAGVAIVRSETDAGAYLATSDSDVIAQEYVRGPEFGVFYRRYPWEETGRVVSITAKILPEVTGDGRRTLSELILCDGRAFCLYRRYLAALRHDPGFVPAAGERIPLVEVGSHCRGAICLDASHLRTDGLEREIERVSRSHPGFHYGRFDVRSESVEAFQQGRFKVLELNGVGSEPTHVYDPAIAVREKYRILRRHWREMFNIGAANRANGHQPTPIRELLQVRSRTALPRKTIKAAAS